GRPSPAACLAVGAAGDDALMSWGWRLPCLFSVILIGVGIWVRLRIEETPVFEHETTREKVSTPILYALRFNWLPVLMGFGIIAMSSGVYVIATTFVQNYATGPDVAIGADTILAAMTVASFVEAVVTLPLAALGDKW